MQPLTSECQRALRNSATFRPVFCSLRCFAHSLLNYVTSCLLGPIFFCERIYGWLSRLDKATHVGFMLDRTFILSQGRCVAP